MANVENTVFISYRRKDISWALLVYHYLTANGYDVFFDFTSIPSGDFEQIIVSNIKARAHFLIILTPSALDRCSEPRDWLRREIEIAIREKRNIIPIFFDDFSFGIPSISEKLTGDLATIKKYNGLEVPASYFNAAMERLCNQYLNVALDAVLHPVSDEVKKVVIEQQVAADKAISQKKEVEKPAKKRVTKKASAQPESKPEKKELPDRLMLKDMEFCKVPSGAFLMGSDGRKDKAAYDDEKPQHSVNIPYDYWMARFPVTNEQYDVFVQSKRGRHPVADWMSKRDHPVVKVSWHNAIAYCLWLNDFLKKELQEGLVLRLPTEAEWEKTARGADGRIYPWGNTFDEDKCNTDEGGKGDTTPVDAYSPEGDSPFGCADMCGNVWEWTHSLYKSYPFREDDGREYDETGDYEHRVLRGGSWSGDMLSARVSNRCYSHPNSHWYLNGFRILVVFPPS